jgi:hypothetical protein
MSTDSVPAGDSGKGSGADLANMVKNWCADLRKLVDEMQEMVETYEDYPGTIDSSLERIREKTRSVNAIMRLLYAKKIPLNDDTWQAFEQQKTEYRDFYKSVSIAVDTHEYVLARHPPPDSGARPPPKLDNLEQEDRNWEVFSERRWKCIEALRDFRDKVSEMLDF